MKLTQYLQQITAITATILLPTEANSASHKAQAKAIISTKYFQLTARPG
jgi:hypothetical protein